VDAKGADTVQRAGKFVMYWYAAPESDSAGTVVRCLS
jgi:hypothetical protein